MERLQLGRERKGQWAVRAWEDPTTPLLLTFPVSGNLTRLAGTVLSPSHTSSAEEWPQLTWGAWPHFTSGQQTPRNEARAEPRESPGPHGPHVTRPAHLCPHPLEVRPRRGGASPALSTQTCHVTEAGAKARVQSPCRPKTLSSSQPQNRGVERAEARAPRREERAHTCPWPRPRPTQVSRDPHSSALSTLMAPDRTRPRPRSPATAAAF